MLVLILSSRWSYDESFCRKKRAEAINHLPHLCIICVWGLNASRSKVSTLTLASHYRWMKPSCPSGQRHKAVLNVPPQTNWPQNSLHALSPRFLSVWQHVPICQRSSACSAISVVSTGSPFGVVTCSHTSKHTSPIAELVQTLASFRLCDFCLHRLPAASSQACEWVQ